MLRPALRVIVTLLVAGLLTLACADTPSSFSWSQWRGPDGLGVAPDVRLPTHWSASSSNIRWRTEIPGVGNSQPITSGDRVFVSYAYLESPGGPQDQDRWRALMAVNLETGNVDWQTPIVKAPSEQKHRLNTYAGSTPITDGTHIWVCFGSTLAKLTVDGELLWTREIDPDYAEFSRYGVATSPVLTRDSVIILQDQESAQTEDLGWLAAFDKETGDQRWRVEWDHTCCTYTTPLVRQRGGREELIVARSAEVVGFDALSGEQLWQWNYEINQLVSSPVMEGDLLLVTGGAHNVRGNYGLRMRGSGVDTEIELVWEDRRLAPHTSSAVVNNGLLYTVTDQGLFVCRRSGTGEILWQTRLGPKRTRASLVLGDGKLYVASSGGVVVVVAAKETEEVLAKNSLGEAGSNATPAVADGCLLVRTKVHLVCIEPESGDVET